MAADLWGGIPTPPWDGLNTTGVFKGLHLPPEVNSAQDIPVVYLRKCWYRAPLQPLLASCEYCPLWALLAPRSGQAGCDPASSLGEALVRLFPSHTRPWSSSCCPELWAWTSEHTRPYD